MGFIADVLSKPVLVGYITGVGLTLLSSQLQKLTGVPIDADTFFPRVGEFVTNLDEIHAATLAMGLVTLGLILVLRRKAPRAPGALIAVTAATAVSALFDLDEHGIAVVGEIPPGLPRLAWPDVGGGDLGRLLPVALGIALVGYSDNILTSRSIAARLRYRVDANQELAALGAINVAAGLAQGFPISSSASRTAVPASLGSHTQLVGIVGAAFLAASLLLLRPVLAEIPQPALAAVIVAAAIAIIDLAGFAALGPLQPVRAALGRRRGAGRDDLRRAHRRPRSRWRCRSWWRSASWPAPTTPCSARASASTGGSTPRRTRARPPSKACSSTGSTRHCSSPTSAGSASGCVERWTATREPSGGS